ncbi:MAG TPA: FHA domain-containing protein [Gaiellaceae bacterium]
MSYLYCPECGFRNPESANYCSKCGALLVKDESGETTQQYTLDDGHDEAVAALEDVGIKGPALVVRSGGGRSGETFHPEGERTTIGRSPDCEIFLDDVTVSRKHAAIIRRDGSFFVEDLGSLNGTFLNRRRIESGELADGDELQIGKYRLTFLLK